MKTLISLLFGVIIQGHALASPEGDQAKPFMVDKMTGWKMQYTDKAMAVMRTTDGGKNWTDVSPPAMAVAAKNEDPVYYEDITGLCPLDAQRAWMAITLKDRVILEYTASGGRDWREGTGPEAMDAVFLSFLNEKEGFVLTMSGSLGNHHEGVYHTNDATLHWETLSPPPEEGTSYYATGISFRTLQEGWITATYHGAPDAPLFHTSDGGKTWHAQLLEIPIDYRGGYADTYPPVFIGADKKQGYLPVKLVRHEPEPGHYAWVNYVSDDGGATWHLPAAGVSSMPDN